MSKNNIYSEIMITTHDKCGLPIDLCICGGEDDSHAVYELGCRFCGSEYIGVAPPGVPMNRFQCPQCTQQGFIKAR